MDDYLMTRLLDTVLGVAVAVAVAILAYYPRIYLTLYVSYWDFLDFLLPWDCYCLMVNHLAL
jgi:uncharacterized membrane protein YccC